MNPNQIKPALNAYQTSFNDWAGLFQAFSWCRFAWNTLMWNGLHEDAYTCPLEAGTSTAVHRWSMGTLQHKRRRHVKTTVTLIFSFYVSPSRVRPPFNVHIWEWGSNLCSTAAAWSTHINLTLLLEKLISRFGLETSTDREKFLQAGTVICATFGIEGFCWKPFSRYISTSSSVSKAQKVNKIPSRTLH